MQDGRFVAMVTKDLETLNLKFDQVMFNSLVLKWEGNFELTFGIFSTSFSRPIGTKFCTGIDNQSNSSNMENNCIKIMTS